MRPQKLPPALTELNSGLIIVTAIKLHFILLQQATLHIIAAESTKEHDHQHKHSPF